VTSLVLAEVKVTVTLPLGCWMRENPVVLSVPSTTVTLLGESVKAAAGEPLASVAAALLPVELLATTVKL